MNVLDTNILSLVFMGDRVVNNHIVRVGASSIYIPAISVEEIFRGRLAFIRAADSSKQAARIEYAYHQLQLSTVCMSQLQQLPYLQQAETLVRSWKTAKIKVGTQDMRIAAIAITHNAMLVTRNVRDFAQIPSLNFVTW